MISCARADRWPENLLDSTQYDRFIRSSFFFEFWEISQKNPRLTRNFFCQRFRRPPDTRVFDLEGAVQQMVIGKPVLPRDPLSGLKSHSNLPNRNRFGTSVGQSKRIWPSGN